MDAALTVRRDTSAAQVNALLHSASQQRLQGARLYRSPHGIDGIMTPALAF